MLNHLLQYANEINMVNQALRPMGSDLHDKDVSMKGLRQTKRRFVLLNVVLTAAGWYELPRSHAKNGQNR